MEADREKNSRQKRIPLETKQLPVFMDASLNHMIPSKY